MPEDSIQVTINWNPNIEKITEGSVVKAMNNAGIHLQRRMKENFARNAYQVFKRWKMRGVKGPDKKWIMLPSGKRYRYREAVFKYSVSRSASLNPLYGDPAADFLGDFPSIRTGKLRRSIGIIRAKRGSLSVTVGTNLAYGRYLEYGTRKMAARPWCRRTFNEERAKILQIIRQDAAKEITAQLGGK